MKKTITFIIAATAALVIIFSLYIGGNTPYAHQLQAFATGEMAKFALQTDAKNVPDIAVTNARGEDVRLSDYRGKVLLINFWATWCAPCRHEMPALERLQQQLGSKDFEVLIISMDRGGLKTSQKFLDDIGVTALKPLIDDASRLGRAMGAFGLPTTIMVDRNGKEIGRLVGPAVWDAPEALTLIQQSLLL